MKRKNARLAFKLGDHSLRMVWMLQYYKLFQLFFIGHRMTFKAFSQYIGEERRMHGENHFLTEEPHNTRRSVIQTRIKWAPFFHATATVAHSVAKINKNSRVASKIYWKA